jgi:hypothetical protein
VDSVEWIVFSIQSTSIEREREREREREVHIRLAAFAACDFVPAAAGMPLVRQCNASVDIQGAEAGASTPTISTASGIAAA